MLISRQLATFSGVNKASVMMGTPANIEILRATGFSSQELDSAKPGDLVLALDLDNVIDVTDVVTQAEEALRSQVTSTTSSGLRSAHSLARALEITPDANLALVSIPGEYVAD